MGKAEEVVNFSDEEDCPECPLCMEALEIDDQTFFPCGCGYQICRFCWHRIRTNDNGLCPACRREYKEDPVNFKPLTCEDIVRIKNEKKQRSLEKKQKMAESRKHLSDIRVLQRNLVFVTGIPPKLADVEILKKPEYFGRYGKIHKCVLNQQGPVATAYATYVRDEDAFKAVLGINGTYLQNNILRASLGTTKYCSYFLRHLPCPKQDCMYLHGLGDSSASFTKADMQAGKHQQYENIIFREYFSKKAETMKQNMSRQKITAKDDLTCGTAATRDAWCAQPAELLDNRNIRSMSESEHSFYNKTSISDPDLSSGSRESGSLEPPNTADWNEINSQRRNSLSSPSEDELDFDPWEISKDGLEELIQNQSQAGSESPTTSSVPQLPTTTTQPSFNMTSHFQNNFINHIQPKPEPFSFQSFQQNQPSQPFAPFSLSGLQQPHHNPNSVDRLFGGIPSHMGPLPQFNQKKSFSVSDGFYNGYDGAPPTVPHFSDIRLHDPSIVSTSPQDLRRVNSSPAAPQQNALDMSSLQQGLQELFPHANISFSDPNPFGSEGLYGAGRAANDMCQRVRQAPPGFQNVTPNHTNLLLCQQLQNEHKVIKIQ
ncbi:CCR4-NOT transcription complex subunit 4-like isoform X2 [Bolinopsis microptera]|uniref:CCR4-NOT transcription complex subunit 4-like isoform X2 n=1 Tax=Bolinopsis microptera TaxID=2820187 RepID=UPI0030796103